MGTPTRRARGWTTTELLGSLLAWPTAGYLLFHLVKVEQWGLLSALGVAALAFVAVQVTIHVVAAVADSVGK
jgi:hypothetical protein